jgi:hypothetical protein
MDQLLEYAVWERSWWDAPDDRDPWEEWVDVGGEGG